MVWFRNQINRCITFTSCNIPAGLPLCLIKHFISDLQPNKRRFAGILTESIRELYMREGASQSFQLMERSVSPVRRPPVSPSCFLGTEAWPEWRKAHWKVTIRASTWRSEKRHKLSLMHRVELLRYQGIPKSTHQCHLCDSSQELLPILYLYFKNDKKFTHLVLRDNKVEYFWTPNYECTNEGQIACNGI